MEDTKTSSPARSTAFLAINALHDETTCVTEAIPALRQTGPGTRPGPVSLAGAYLFFAADFLLGLDFLAVDFAGLFAVLLVADPFLAAVFEALALAGALAVAFLPVDLAAVLDATDFLDADLAGDLLAEALAALDLAGALVADAFFVGATVAFFPALEVVFLAPRVAPPRPRS